MEMNGTPMFPQVLAGSPAARSMSPASEVVVLLPLLPVIATIVPSR